MANQNRYNFFSYNIDLSEDKIDVFIHEFYHHLQNVTTYLGAERLNLFVQLLGHIAQLGAITKKLKSPLTEWKAQETDKNIHKEINEILSHIDIWGYLEKEQVERNTFRKDHLEHIVIGKPHAQGKCNPCYVDQLAEEIIGYTIGGFVMTESSAFSVQQLFKDKAHNIQKLRPRPEEYQYTLLPYLVESFLEEEKQTYLATFLFAELALSIGSPASGFLSLWSILNENENLITDVSKTFNELKGSLQDEIQMTHKIAEEFVFNTKESAKNLSDHIKQLIYWQCDQLLDGLKLRNENCYFIANHLLENPKEGLIFLVEKFSPLTINIEGKETVNSNVNFSQILALYNDVILSLIANPKKFVKDYKNDLLIELAPENTNKYNISIIIDNDNTTNNIGYVLHTMNLDSFTLEII